MISKHLIVIVLVLCGAVGAAAQSTDQSNPTPITSSELTIKGPKKNNQQYYYSFTGGPGEVTITLNVKAKSYSTFVGIKVVDAELNTLTDHNMSADTSSPGMAKKKFDVGEKQTLILSFTSDSSLAECKIKLGGAVEFSAADAAPTSSDAASTGSTSASPSSADVSAMPAPTASEVDPAAQVTTASNSTGKNKGFTMSILDAVGQRFNIPANGKLRIEMKDGTVQEVDLSQVKKILVKQ